MCLLKNAEFRSQTPLKFRHYFQVRVSLVPILFILAPPYSIHRYLLSENEWGPLLLSYQNLSPNLILLNCSLIKAVAVGPKIDPFNGFSDRDPEYKSISSTDLRHARYQFLIETFNILFQYFSKLLFKRISTNNY